MAENIVSTFQVGLWHISQSHLAKIETGKVDPGYALVSKLFDALDSKKQGECWLYMTKQWMRARKGDKVEDVYEPMRNKGFSQMPVFDGDHYSWLDDRETLARAAEALPDAFRRGCHGGFCHRGLKRHPTRLK
jgi:hypothetical protein